MVGPYVRGQQVPAPVRTMPLDGRHYHCPTRLVEHIGTLEHFSTFCQDALCIGLPSPAANQIVTPIHRSRFVAVQAGAVAGERDEIPQTAPLRSRLGLACHYARICSIRLHSNESITFMSRTLLRSVNCGRSGHAAILVKCLLCRFVMCLNISIGLSLTGRNGNDVRSLSRQSRF